MDQYDRDNGRFRVHDDSMQDTATEKESLISDISQNTMDTLASDSYTLDEAIEHIGFGKFQIKLMAVAGLCWMCDSMEIMLLAILAPHLLCIWDLSSFQEASFTTMVFIGISCGAPLWGWISNKYGRKKGLYLSAVWMLVFGLVSASSQNYAMILVLRGLVGVGVGGIVQAIVVITEMMPTSKRVTGPIVVEVFFTFGSALSSILAIPTLGGILSVEDAMESSNWRLYLVLVTLPLFGFLCTALWMPESPYYLLTTGRYKEATLILERMATDNNTTLPIGSLAAVEVNEYRGRVKDMFVPGLRLVTCLLLGLWFTNQFSYFGIILLTPTMFQTHIDGCHPHGMSVTGNSTCNLLQTEDYVQFVWMSVVEIPGLLFTLLLLFFIGRRITIAILCGLSAICFFTLCACLPNTSRDAILFICRASTASLIQVIYLYTAEVYPTSMRAISMGVCHSLARFGAILTPFVAQVLIHKSFYSVVLLYSILLVICIFAALYLPVETRDRVLENKAPSVEYLANRRVKSQYEQVR